MKIAVGNSRMDKRWKNRDISWVDLCARVGSTIRTTETVEEYRKLKKGAQDNIKAVSYTHLRPGRRLRFRRPTWSGRADGRVCPRSPHR